VPFDFTPQTCGQIVDNFERLYAARRLSLDYKHLAANPASDAPEQNLAYFSGLCVISGGRPVKLGTTTPAPAPDPGPAPGRPAAEVPRLTAPTAIDGLWGFCCELTPLGKRCCPTARTCPPTSSPMMSMSKIAPSATA